jgi:Holliday junction resolvase RusA-like endonuclease
MSDHADQIQFRVEGQPAPAGSKTAYPAADGNSVRVVDAAKGGAAWTATVALAATQAMRGRDPLQGPLRLVLMFYRVRPRGHYRTGKNAHLLREGAPDHPTTKPDVLKLARRVEDALSGICYADDALICQEVLSKVWGATPAVDVTLQPIQPGVQGVELPGAPPPRIRLVRHAPSEDTSPAF